MTEEEVSRLGQYYNNIKTSSAHLVVAIERSYEAKLRRHIALQNPHGDVDKLWETEHMSASSHRLGALERCLPHTQHTVDFTTLLHQQALGYDVAMHDTGRLQLDPL